MALNGAVAGLIFCPKGEAMTGLFRCSGCSAGARLALLLSLFWGSSSAAVPPPITATPAQPELGVFVGNFGELLKYPTGYIAEAQMHGSKEVVILHPASLDLQKIGDSFRPEDFEKHGLVELLVIPKNPAGTQATKADAPESLKALCNRKAETLYEGEVKHLWHTCDPDRGCPIVGYDWPRGTCQFIVQTPYRLFQIYTESKTEFYVLTSAKDFAEPQMLPIVFSLRDSIGPPSLKAHPWKKIAPTDVELIIWFVFNSGVIVLLLLLAIPLKRWRTRLFYIGTSSVASINLMMAFGLAVTAAAHLLAVAAINDSIVIGFTGACLAPLIAWAVARRLKAMSPGVVFRATVCAAMPFAFLCLYERNKAPEPPLDCGPTMSYLIMPLFGILVGLAFGGSISFAQGKADEA
jgi:hypothetical protein